MKAGCEAGSDPCPTEEHGAEPPALSHAPQRRLSPDEDEDCFAVVGAIHDPGGAQEGHDHVDQARVHLVHLVEEEGRPAAARQVALDPALQVLLGKTSTKLSGGEIQREEQATPEQGLR